MLETVSKNNAQIQMFKCYMRKKTTIDCVFKIYTFIILLDVEMLIYFLKTGTYKYEKQRFFLQEAELVFSLIYLELL